MPLSSRTSSLPNRYKGAATAAFLLVLLVAVLPFLFSSEVPASGSVPIANAATDGGNVANVEGSVQPPAELVAAGNLTGTVQTETSLGVQPNPVAVGDSVLFTLTVSPSPPTSNDRFGNLTLLVARPDGTAEILGPFQSEPNGRVVINYTPDLIGSYSIQLAYGGQFFSSSNITYLGAMSPETTLVVSSDEVPVPRTEGTWIVDDDGPADFQTIQAAINAAFNGDKVLVRPGTYRENVVVNKSLSVIGESAGRVTITPQTAGIVVTITVSSVTFEGFRILGSGKIHQNDYLGIYFANPNATSSIVRGNNISANGYGISVSGSQNSIEGNSFVNNDLGGILVNHSSNNLIMRNNVTGNDSMFGIFISDSSYNNILRNNYMTGSDLNLHIASFRLEEMIHDIDTSNRVNGKPVYYWINKNNQAVPHDAGAVYLINCSGITVQNLEIEYNGIGVLLGYSKNCVVEKNHFTGCSNAIRLESSSSNIIRNNVIYEPEDCGIAVVRSSTNTVCNNTIWSSTEADGLFVFTSSENQFYNNNLCCKHPVWTETYSNIYCSRNNKWDNGYPAGGNYWSDYNGTDANHDGIGDAPYVIDANNTDRYPLMNPPER